MVMEAGEFLSLPSARWRPRRASGVKQSTFAGLKTRGANGVNPHPLMAEDVLCGVHLSSEAGKKEVNSPFLLLLLFYSDPGGTG